MDKLTIIYCATPDIAVPTLDRLVAHPQVRLVLVVCPPDRPVGRGRKMASPPIGKRAKELALPLLQTDDINKEERGFETIERESVDAVLLFAFAHFLGDRLLRAPKLGCFNIHPSLLPQYRGAAPIQHALLNGELSSGVSLQKLVKKMDAGDLVLWKEFPLGPEETGGEVQERASEVASELAVGFVDQALSEALTYTPQDETQVSFAPRLNREDGWLDFKGRTCRQIYNQVRAFEPWPGTFCTLKVKGESKRLKVLRAISMEMKASDAWTNVVVAPGEVDTGGGQLIVGCRQGQCRLIQVQLEGKKPCVDREFLNGMKESFQLG